MDGELARLEATVSQGFARTVDLDLASVPDPQGIGGPAPDRSAAGGYRPVGAGPPTAAGSGPPWRRPEIATAPTNASASPTTAMSTCQAGRLSRSSKSRMPIRTETTGFATETVATVAASCPMLRHLLQHERQDAGERHRVELPAREHRLDADVQRFDAGLHEAGRRARTGCRPRCRRGPLCALPPRGGRARARRRRSIASARTTAHRLFGASSRPPAGSP